MANFSYVQSDFYCPKCGNKSYNILRKKGHEKPSLHRKRMYCIYCKTDINMIECRTPEDVEEFKSMYNNGDFSMEVHQTLNLIEKENKVSTLMKKTK